MSEGESTVTKHDHNNSAIALNLKLEDSAGFTTDDSSEPTSLVAHINNNSNSNNQPKKLLISFDEAENDSEEEDEEDNAEDEKQKADLPATETKVEETSGVEPVKRHKNPKRTEKRLQQQQQQQQQSNVTNESTPSIPTNDSTTTNTAPTQQKNSDLLGMDTSKLPKLQSTVVDGALDRIEKDKYDTQAWTVLFL